METEQKVLTGAKDKFKFRFNVNLAIAIILLLIALAMAGLFSWATAGFRTDPLQSVDFWFSLIISTIINLFALLSSITYDLPNRLEKDERILEREKALLDFNITTDATMLELFVIKINSERKRIMHIRRIKRQEIKFIRKYKPTLEERKCWHTGTEKEKETNEYCVRLNEYKYLQSDEYITENLQYLDVKYPEITTSMILSESMARQGDLGYIHTQTQKARWWVLFTIPRYMVNMSLAVAWAIFFVQMAQDVDGRFWLDFLIKLMGMFLNIATGLYLTRLYVKNIVLGDLDFRLSLARQFIMWHKNHQPVITIKQE